MSLLHRLPPNLPLKEQLTHRMFPAILTFLCFAERLPPGPSFCSGLCDIPDAAHLQHAQMVTNSIQC